MDHLLFWWLENVGSMFEHRNTRRFDEAVRNSAAEQHVMNILQEAAHEDVRSFQVRRAEQSEDAVERVVDVLLPELQGVSHTMHAPGKRAQHAAVPQHLSVSHASITWHGCLHKG
jgi:hypothetical protein